MSYIPMSELLAQIKAIEGCESTKRKIIGIFNATVGARFYNSRRDTVHQMHIQAATSALNAGSDRASAAKQLSERYNVSSQTAYNWINEAINQRAKNNHTPEQGSLL
jgi:hypothetical protein